MGTSTLVIGGLDAEVKTDSVTKAGFIEATAASTRFFARKSRKVKDSDCHAECCFRESRISRGECETINEDIPSTMFDCDLMVLELHSLLRSREIQPSDNLVTDLLQWQARASKRGQPIRTPK